jgi:hypothetical protein
MPPGAPKALHVTVVAQNPETSEGLTSYFRSVGVASAVTSTLHQERIPSAANAVVLFPDELDASTVIAEVRALRARRPTLRLVVVTSSAPRLRPALDADSHSTAPIVLPKPAFGWSILDAIREQPPSETP